MPDRVTNLRYVAYARATGAVDADAALERDRATGHACMLPFILWMGVRAREYARARGIGYDGGGFRKGIDHDDYTAWLRSRAEELLAEARP